MGCGSFYGPPPIGERDMLAVQARSRLREARAEVRFYERLVAELERKTPVRSRRNPQ